METLAPDLACSIICTPTFLPWLPRPESLGLQLEVLQPAPYLHAVLSQGARHGADISSMLFEQRHQLLAPGLFVIRRLRAASLGAADGFGQVLDVDGLAARQHHGRLE